MKNKIKRILKIFFILIVVLLITYVIYAVGHAVYANKEIDKIMNAVANSDTETLYEYDNDSLDWVCNYIKDYKDTPNINIFSYEKVKTKYSLDTIYFEYDIKVANYEDVLKKGVNTQVLLENFDESYIKRRQLKKETLKKLGIYNQYSEEIQLDKYNTIPDLNQEVFFELINEAAYKDEAEYNNETEIIKVEITYNIFTHEIEGLHEFYDVKCGKELTDSALKASMEKSNPEFIEYIASTLYVNDHMATREEAMEYAIYDEKYPKRYFEEYLSYNLMCKSGESLIKIISLKDNFLSAYEPNEGNITNEKEKLFIETEMTLDEIEEYLLSNGYIYPNGIFFENENKTVSFTAFFERDKLMCINGQIGKHKIFIGRNSKKNITDQFWTDEKEKLQFLEDKMNYFIENNLSRDEIINELAKEGYFSNEYIFLVNPETGEAEWLENEDTERIEALKEKGYIRKERLDFYKPNYGYVRAIFLNENVSDFYGNGSAFESEIEELLEKNVLTKNDLILMLEEKGFEIEQ